MKKNKKELAMNIGRKSSTMMNKLIFAGIAIVMIHTLSNISREEVRTEFTVYEKSKKGKVEILKVRTTKIPKPVMNKNLLSISYDANGGKNLEYRRHMGKVLFLDAYGGAGVTQSATGMSYSIGLTVGF